jgi:hypothetical protein
MTTGQMMTDSQNGSLSTSMTTKENVFECSIDQINDGIALLTHPDHLPLAIPLTFLPSAVKEGDLMIVSFNLAPRQKQEEIKNQVSALLQKQAQDDDGGDFSI